MCGRFTQHYAWHEVEDLYGLDGTPRNLAPHYNIAPTDTVDVVVRGDAGPALAPMRWGLVPAWWKKTLRELPATFNARAETVADKPMFRDAFRRRRCIVPASGYYEWTAGKAGKDPWYISASGGGVLSFAGLWDTWKDPQSGTPLRSCTIIVTAANALTATVHDRMPVLLEPDGFAAWLDGSAGAQVLRPAAEAALRMWPVSRRVNRSGQGDDDPALIAATAPAPPLV